MSDEPDIDDPGARMLARLAEMDLAAAERAHARMMAADDATFDQAGRTYQRMARSLRQTLALKAQLERARAAREPAAPKPTGAALARRADELRQGVMRVMWDEAETTEAIEWRLEMLDETISDEIMSDSFCDEALDEHVARVCSELDLEPERAQRWRDLPDPPRELDGADQSPRESSA